MTQPSKLKSLTKQSVLAAASAATSTAALSSVAHAELIILDPGAVNQTIDLGKSGLIDINSDGIFDFKIEVNDGPDSKIDEYAKITGLNRLPDNGVDDRVAAFVVDGGTTQKSNVFVTDKNAPSGLGNFLERFGPGDDVFVDQTGDVLPLLVDEGPTSKLRNKGIFYVASDSEGDVGPFQDIDDVGYIGLVVDIFNAPFHAGGINAELVNVESIDTVDDAYMMEPVMIGTRNFAWLEVSRGSINVINAGFQTFNNTPAPIPNPTVGVPEPATLPLMALGAAGLFALRRKRAA